MNKRKKLQENTSGDDLLPLEWRSAKGSGRNLKEWEEWEKG